jgi:kinesin family protein C2/C3
MQMSVNFPSDEDIVIQNAEKKTQHAFQFEKIFTPQSTQVAVFDEIEGLIGSVLDGYNVCIFAYGQTGSGKTHTMEGYRDDPGVNIRALQRLFDGAEERREDFEYNIEITLLEIYNERIQDLLSESGGKILKPKTGQYGMEVPELTRIKVSNKDQVLAALKRGSKNRHVQSTAMNDTSSRSHLILSVYVLGRSRLLNREVMGKLHLIDLAGSERVGRSGATGETLKEAQHINQSLSALGNVIHARANKNGHVPYRDSTLTHLLQDSLDKNSKTLMFVQVSPSPLDSAESLQSLRFASRVREVELGKAEANVSSSSGGDGDKPARPASAKTKSAGGK